MQPTVEVWLTFKTDILDFFVCHIYKGNNFYFLFALMSPSAKGSTLMGAMYYINKRLFIFIAPLKYCASIETI